MSNPSTPELSFRPDFMIDFDNRLTFVEITFRKAGENVDWNTLRLIEEIFEVKLFFGDKSVFTLILLDEENWKPYCLELLEGFFDKIVYGSIQRASDVYTEPKADNFRLWDLERKFNASRYRKPTDMELEQFQFEHISGWELEQVLANKLFNLGLFPLRNHSVRNLKNYYLKRDMDLRFFFDFFVNEKIVDIKTIRRMKMPTLQNLLIKSRLIRYKKVRGRVVRSPPVEMLLFVNGNISGPEYDKARYFRMLTAAGWDVYPITLLRDESRLREVFLS